MEPNIKIDVWLFFAGRETETRNSTHGNVISGTHWFPILVFSVLQTRHRRATSGRRVTPYVRTTVCDQPNTLCTGPVTFAHVLRVGIRVILRLFKLSNPAKTSHPYQKSWRLVFMLPVQEDTGSNLDSETDYRDRFSQSFEENSGVVL
jgi:hypothetical protein